MRRLSPGEVIREGRNEYFYVPKIFEALYFIEVWVYVREFRVLCCDGSACDTNRIDSCTSLYEPQHSIK